MLAVARRRAAAEKVAGVAFIEADAQTRAIDRGTFDAVFSRFGVMFFADPVAAFANLRTALRPGGRLTFLCWRKPADNPCLMAPYRAAVDLFPVPPEKTDPLAPGPFAFADPERVEDILGRAGFAAVALTPHDQPIGGHTPDRALHLALHIGPLARLLREQPSVTAQVTEAVRNVLAAHTRPDGVYLGSGTWVVTARA
jgi:SAM-dependent methyltransferase